MAHPEFRLLVHELQSVSTAGQGQASNSRYGHREHGPGPAVRPGHLPTIRGLPGHHTNVSSLAGPFGAPCFGVACASPGQAWGQAVPQESPAPALVGAVVGRLCL